MLHTIGVALSLLSLVALLAVVVWSEVRGRRFNSTAKEFRQYAAECKRKSDSGEMPTIPFRKTEQRSVRQS